MLNQNLANPAHESALIKKSKDGNGSALNQLLHNYKSRIYSFIFSKGIKCHHDVEDLVQDTFIQVYKSIASFEFRSKFSSWVLGIALNIVRNHLNRSAQYKYNFVDALEAVLIDSNVSNEPDRAVAAKSAYRDVNKQMQRLPEQLSECLQMICIDGLSYADTADTLAISVSNLKSRIFRARKELSYCQ
ncbi:RNA polymerase sigma factor [Thalassomonas haliotis]|uniref:RNA polymerase sigma factor n=1 Tax=Thalassomonas haliotis TaxID=485448 RepID=A0ABY7V843_9GAMM|nr:RNA polymerase sigma factor [Thalassomonas haliotis]WDE09430.1 RNA polymerase sigma factor [Thalassomonas haliotis]